MSNNGVCPICDGTEILPDGRMCKCKFERIFNQRFPELLEFPLNKKFLKFLSTTDEVTFRLDKSKDALMSLIKSFMAFRIVTDVTTSYKVIDDTYVIETVFYDDPEFKMSHLYDPDLLVYKFEGIPNKLLPAHLLALFQKRLELNKATWFIFGSSSIVNSFSNIYSSDLKSFVFNFTLIK